MACRSTMVGEHGEWRWRAFLRPKVLMFYWWLLGVLNSVNHRRFLKLHAVKPGVLNYCTLWPCVLNVFWVQALSSTTEESSIPFGNLSSDGWCWRWLFGVSPSLKRQDTKQKHDKHTLFEVMSQEERPGLASCGQFRSLLFQGGDIGVGYFIHTTWYLLYLSRSFPSPIFVERMPGKSHSETFGSWRSASRRVEMLQTPVREPLAILHWHRPPCVTSCAWQRSPG